MTTTTAPARPSPLQAAILFTAPLDRTTTVAQLHALLGTRTLAGMERPPTQGSVRTTLNRLLQRGLFERVDDSGPTLWRPTQRAANVRVALRRSDEADLELQRALTS